MGIGGSEVGAVAFTVVVGARLGVGTGVGKEVGVGVGSDVRSGVNFVAGSLMGWDEGTVKGTVVTPCGFVLAGSTMCSGTAAAKELTVQSNTFSTVWQLPSPHPGGAEGQGKLGIPDSPGQHICPLHRQPEPGH